jgi:DNA gyrase subunit A
MADKIAKELVTIDVEDELKKSYLAYAMNVIVSRALPDVRDGLKPVHRRTLYAMYEAHNDWNKAYRKSARIVGNVMGKYHPHGDMSIYDTIVRMAQEFSLRYPLVDGQGNFGSIDGDSAAAMRYTEVRMSRIAHYLLSDLEKETVDFIPNYDETETMPSVLPTRVPNLLINGSSGIAVGMATNIPPHNLNEVIDACLAMIKKPNIDLAGLMKHIHGPDFPTAGMINGRSGIVDAYRTGRGRVIVRAKSHIEETKSSKQSIVFTELPYQVNKARLLEKIGELVKNKVIEGISALRDESDKDGIRVVVELRRGENADVLLNNLHTHTPLQTVFGINMVVLDRGQPRLMNLKQVLEAFIDHRREVVIKRTVFELRKAKERAHLLEGLGIALSNIDKIVALIKTAKTPKEAKVALLDQPWPPGRVLHMLERAGAESGRPEGLPAQYGLQKKGYFLSPDQAQAILDLKLHRLTGLEQDKIYSEYKELLDTIKNLYEILLTKERLMEIISSELKEVKQQFGDTRLTEIIENQETLADEDLIPKTEIVITLSHEGYIKAQPLETYQAQRRGGKGKLAAGTKDTDFIKECIIASSHDTLLCFSNRGRVYWLRGFQIPQASRQSKGRPIVNLLPLASHESITALAAVRTFSDDRFVLMATSQGTVKKIVLKHFAKPRSNGLIAVDLKDGDRLVGAEITDGKQTVTLFNNAGKAIRFNEDQVRAMGRTARGVRGMKLKKDQFIIALVISKPPGSILTVTENGYGKRTSIEEYRTTGRAGQGIISIQVTQRNGQAISALQVSEDEEIMLMTEQGVCARIPVSDISLIGRNTQGVRLIGLKANDKLVTVAKIAESCELVK